MCKPCCYFESRVRTWNVNDLGCNWKGHLKMLDYIQLRECVRVALHIVSVQMFQRCGWLSFRGFQCQPRLESPASFLGLPHQEWVWRVTVTLAGWGYWSSSWSMGGKKYARNWTKWMMNEGSHDRQWEHEAAQTMDRMILSSTQVRKKC